MKVRLTNRVHISRRGLVWWIAGGTAVVLASVGALAALAGDGDAKHAATTTTRVQRGTVTTTVSAAGTAQPLQSRG
jgi:multidrug efflux pump subunit AcrA (membrane-fusion protein)